MKPYKNKKNPKKRGGMKIEHNKPPWGYRRFYYRFSLFGRNNINSYILNDNMNKMNI